MGRKAIRPDGRPLTPAESAKRYRDRRKEREQQERNRWIDELYYGSMDYLLWRLKVLENSRDADQAEIDRLSAELDQRLQASADRM